MLAARALGRSTERPLSGLVASAALFVVMASSGHAEPVSVSPPPGLALENWDGKRAVTIEELKSHATKIGELLDHASSRVDRLTDQAPAGQDGDRLVSAIRQELSLSRKWNRHLTSILMEVTEARRDLGIREREAAAEIIELTSIAEQARLELVALKKSLTLDRPLPSGDESAPSPIETPGIDQRSTLDAGHRRIDLVAEGLAGPHATIEDARRTLDDMAAAQKIAAGDIKMIRAKIIDALHVLAPHRPKQPKAETRKDTQVESHLTSEDITAWAASIAGKLHHEGFEDAEQAGDGAEPPLASITTTYVEAISMEGQASATLIIRTAPDHRASPIATVAAGSSLLVTGKVTGQDWYRVDVEGNRHGFVFGDGIKRHLAPTAPAKGIKASSITPAQANGATAPVRLR